MEVVVMSSAKQKTTLILDKIQ